MTTLEIIKKSLNKFNAAKAAAMLLQEKYPELLKEPIIQDFVRLLT
jgi:hypothetical protein